MLTSRRTDSGPGHHDSTNQQDRLPSFDLPLVGLTLQHAVAELTPTRSTSIALGLEIVIWFTKSMIGNAVCYALVGIFLGPIYPAALMVISKILPDEIRGGVMGLTGTAGGAGAAALPL